MYYPFHKLLVQNLYKNFKKKIKKSLQVYFYNFHAFNLKTVFQKLHGVTCSNPKHTSKTKIRFTQLRKVLRSSSSSKPTL